jgi:hypothetical protein
MLQYRQPYTGNISNSKKAWPEKDNPMTYHNENAKSREQRKDTERLKRKLPAHIQQ